MAILDGFQRPAKIEIDPETRTGSYGRFVAEPFEKGFGITLGNALRRIMLSSITGGGITSFRAEGVLHEFSTIPGVVEDTTEIILNMKQVRLKVHSEGVKNITYKGKGFKKVTAGDLKTGPDVEIINPSMYLFTIDKEGSVELALTASQGRGYVPAERNKDIEAPIGVIPIDSVFSPVKKVAYRVENARVGQATDYDRLIMEIWTDGSSDPEEVLVRASNILRSYLDLFISPGKHVSDRAEGEAEARDRLREVLRRSVNELDLSVRSYNCLKNANIHIIADLVTRTDAEMLKTKNFGRKSLAELKEILGVHGLTMGMSIEGLVTKEEAEQAREKAMTEEKELE
jgi:DNA-directed RNA polymerase subunit alpha